MQGLAVFVVVLSACSFSLPRNSDPLDPGFVDAPLEGISMCIPGEKICRGRDLGVCDANGTGLDPAQMQSCALGCVEDQCVEASNMPPLRQLGCVASAPKLTPASGTTVRIAASQIECSASCDGAGGGMTISAVDNFDQAVGARMAMYCLGRVTIPSDVTVSVDPGIAAAIGWFVAGNVQIDGAIDIAGKNAAYTAAGGAGPGGGVGGAFPLNDLPGNPGDPVSSCGGKAGDRRPDGSGIGGGGGGGGHAGAGGAGGSGRHNGGTSADGGLASSTCGASSLAPIGGGGGGGSGGDGACGVGVRCGWSGGGGGGALQVSATGAISISASGLIAASGGTGFGSTDLNDRRGGGGGGGAGGAVLLESPSLQIFGELRVTGGNGGESGAGAGGAGATGATLAGFAGASGAADGQGGAGGGGAAGFVRLNSANAACPATVAPSVACSTGTLRPAPAPAPLR